MSKQAIDIPELSGFLYAGLCAASSDNEKRINATTSVQMLAGMFVELSLILEEPEETLDNLIDEMVITLGKEPVDNKEWDFATMPPPHITEHNTESGRDYARQYFEEWGEGIFESKDIYICLAEHCFKVWQEEGFELPQMLRLFTESAIKSMQYEIAAQELCDMAIETKMLNCGWSLGDSISALSGAAGRRLALALDDITAEKILRPQRKAQDYLDNIVYVMTQEAIRLGIPPGTDWRLGLAANDMPVNAPKELVDGAEEFCQPFFQITSIDNMLDQAVACAKAAGRMLAVAAGGELPEMAPAIAKPLAMAAMQETYKSVFVEKAIGT